MGRSPAEKRQKPNSPIISLSIDWRMLYFATNVLISMSIAFSPAKRELTIKFIVRIIVRIK